MKPNTDLTCDKCKYWVNLGHLASDEKSCHLMDDGRATSNDIYAFANYDIYVGPKFGCIKWEPAIAITQQV